MQDKDYDNFFDEKSSEDQKSDQLMQMLNSYDKKVKSFSPGEKVSGKVTRVGSEYVFVDIGARNEAFMKRSELLDDEGEVQVKEGDTLSGFVVSADGGETVISKSLGGHTASVDELRDALNSKMPVQGKVTGVSKGGLNVKIMGHRAFCPVSQIDIKFTSDVNVFLGKTLEFVITRITEGGRNIVVSRVPLLEAGLEDQLKDLAKAAEEKTVLKGKISKVADFGLFVEIGDLEGLVHISEVSWERAQNLGETFSVGQEVEFVVLKVQRKEPLRNSKISLSIKQIFEDPWTKVFSNLSIGESIEGKVTRLADFGAFVEVAPGVEGLVHVSEMSWAKRVHHPSEVVKPGQMVKVTVLNMDENKKSISLTLKDVADDPWNDIEKRFPVGEEVEGTVAKKAKYGYFIDLAEGITGLLVFSNMASDKKDSLKEGDKVTVRMEALDKENRRMSLSYGLEKGHAETEETKKFMEKQQAKSEKKKDASTEFGAALLEALKSKK
ncbi:MAG: S1 RNA-binding domain-containing protein [Chitinispirillaceae bacterium]